MTIRVLIIDDSATMRAILMSRLAEEPDISVIATASDAAEGRELIKLFDPDVVTLDIEMPGMSGLDFLEKIMTLRPTPVIVASGAAQQGSEATARALALGAVDCYAKGDGASGMLLDDCGRLAGMIRRAARSEAAAPRSDTALIAVGASTGGVDALQRLLSGFPADCPPTLVVQHVDGRFAPAIARTLDAASPATVQVAEPDLPLQPGNVYLAPGDGRHLLVGGRERYFARLRRGEAVSGHVPSVDVLFRAVAQTVGACAVGILLTGMGSDGARGMLAMAQAGALTIAQDEASCTVFGMPRAAIELGAAELVAPVEAIARHALRQAA